MAALTDDGITFSFSLDGTFEPVAVRVRQVDGRLVATHTEVGAPRVLEAQLRRMLGLEIDEPTFLSVGKDPLLARLRAEFPGFYTAAKASPWDAATWSIIAPRISMATAAKLKQSIAAQHGERVTLLGREHAIFPSPRLLLDLSLPQLPDEKRVRLVGLAEAALDGKLDASRLRALGEDEALEALQTLRGIGPWSAGHIYYRGVAPLDGLPLSEPRVLHGFRSATDRPDATWDDLVEAAEAWRPLRMWTYVLLMRHLHETPAWNDPSLRTERRQARPRRTSSASRTSDSTI